MELVELGSVCEIVAGQSPPSSSYNKDSIGIPFFQGKADFGRLYPTVRYWCTAPKKMSLPNDILFSVRAPVGSTNINVIEACIGRGLAAIRNSDKIDLKFLLFFLRENETKIASLGTGSTFKAITIKTLKSILIPLPPLPIQKQIAAILDEADKLRQLNKDLIEKYNALTQSLFLDMFGDPFKGETFLLKDNLNIIGGYAFKSSDFVKEGIPLIKIGTVNKGYFESNNFSYLSFQLKDKYSKWIIYPGDILMSLTGTVGKNDYGNVETSSDVYSEYFLNQRVAKLEPANDKYIKGFLFGMFNSPKTKKQLTKLSRGVRQANISNKDIENLKMILPSRELQIKYVDSINLIRQQKQQAQEALQKSEDLFKSLLQKAFKGELVN